jgi:glycosyltransferase involved in cell wall biosynthesis
MPVISVIIPAYNAEKTIAQTIESVLNQSFVDFELLVINDGSTDSTLDVLGQIKDSRIQVFSYGNAGVSAARNRGVSNSSGEFIAFLDADDLWTPDKLQEQLKALEDNKNAGLAYSWTDWIDESGQFLRPGGYINKNGNVFAALLHRDFVESGSNPLIRKQALSEVGGFDDSLAQAEDWDMWLRLAARYEFVCVPKPHILYRICPNSGSSNVWKMEKASLKVIQRILADKPPSIQNQKRDILGSRYQYLTIKSLEGSLDRLRGLTAARFFWLAIINNPAWLKRTKLMLIIFIKIFIAIVLPPKISTAFLKAIKTKKVK